MNNAESKVGGDVRRCTEIAAEKLNYSADGTEPLYTAVIGSLLRKLN
jgi:hypothetical protein